MSRTGNGSAVGRARHKMLASPVASSSQTHGLGAFSFAPPRTVARHHSPAHSVSSSSKGSSSSAQPLAESLLRESTPDASPATSDGNGQQPGPSNQAGMDLCEDVGTHHKVGRRMSISSASSAGPSTAPRRPSDPSRPARRKAARVERAAEIVNYPASDLIHLLASLLQHIARSNDARRASGSLTPVATPAMGLNIDPSTLDHDMTAAAKAAHGSALTTLCFHARNVPSIAIEAYLLRILKYCPTTNEVFLSLLVYFDRMARSVSAPPPSSPSESPGFPPVPDSFAGGFAIDSYNVHRLIIAGITVSSKFHSDVFYTNSRYAKVGGLPLNELNQLELHFLLLNDFQLSIPLEELTEYATNLLHHWRSPPPSAEGLLGMPHRHTDSEVSSSTSTVRGDESSPSTAETDRGQESVGMVAG